MPVVEDNKDMLDFLQSHIGEKYNFYYAENGKSALKVLKAIPQCDLVISDIMMDEMDGREFLEHVYAIDAFKVIPFIFLTAKTTRQEMLDGLRYGAIDFITKPFSINVLMAKIDSVLSVKKEQRTRMMDEVSDKLYSYIMENYETATVDMRHRIKNIGESIIAQYNLTPREIEIINLLHQGYVYKEIAKELHISGNTVETYRKRIFKRCGVQNRTELLNVLFPDEKKTR